MDSRHNDPFNSGRRLFEEPASYGLMPIAGASRRVERVTRILSTQRSTSVSGGKSLQHHLEPKRVIEKSLSKFKVQQDNVSLTRQRLQTIAH